MGHNNKVLQDRAQEIVGRVEGLEKSLQAMLKEVESCSQDASVSSDMQVEQPPTTG